VAAIEWPSAGHPGIRVVVRVAFVAAIVLIDASALRSGYPFSTPSVRMTPARGSAERSPGGELDGRRTGGPTRIGPTLVVIVGALSTEELLRIADSLQRTPSSAFML
jgi:hypothetical protein